MRFVKTLLRPIYRALFERPIWWFLARVKAFFFAETVARLEEIERRLAEASATQYHLAIINQRLKGAEENNAAQWDAMERLLLAFFQQPAFPNVDSVKDLQVQSLSVAGEPNGVNGPHNIR